MNKQQVVSIFILLALLVMFLCIAPPSELANRTSLLSKEYPNSYLINTKTVQYDGQGKISYTVTADRIDSFSSTNVAGGDYSEKYALLKHPRFIFYNHRNLKNNPWLISSEEARGVSNNEELLLTGNVVLKQLTENSPIITTEKLLIKPNLQYVETDKPVSIETRSSITTAIGFRVLLHQKNIELLSNVRSIHEYR